MDAHSEHDHSDILDLLANQRVMMPDMHVGYRWVHPDERTCAHCVRGGECWGEVTAAGLPPNFRYRSGWDEDRLHHHMRGVVGQICGNFEHSNREINARHVQAERRRRDETGEGNEWDTEEN